MGKILLYFFKRAHMKNIGFEKKNITFNKKKLKSHQDTKVCNICGKKDS